MLDQGRLLTEFASILIIGDTDNVYGNPINLKKIVRGFIRVVFLESFLRIRSLPKYTATHEEGRWFPCKRLSTRLKLPSLLLDTRSALILSSFLTLMLARLSPSTNMLEEVGKTPILTPQ
ncbi:hypothetical protein HN51_004851 [Arachis hypogaea]